MARRPIAPKKGRTYRLHITLPGEVLKMLDDKAAEQAAKTPGSVVTRTDVAREAIWAWVGAQKDEGR